MWGWEMNCEGLYMSVRSPASVSLNNYYHFVTPVNRSLQWLPQ